MGQKDIDGTCPVHVAHRRFRIYTEPLPGHKGHFSASAHDFEVDGIYYNIISNVNLEVDNV